MADITVHYCCTVRTDSWHQQTNAFTSLNIVHTNNCICTVSIPCVKDHTILFNAVDKFAQIAMLHKASQVLCGMVSYIARSITWHKSNVYQALGTFTHYHLMHTSDGCDLHLTRKISPYTHM